jgi:hypothetical protein
MLRIFGKPKSNLRSFVVICFSIAVPILCLVIAKANTTNLSLAEHKSTASISQPLQPHIQTSAPPVSSQAITSSQTSDSSNDSKSTAAVSAPITKVPATVSRTSTPSSASTETNNSQLISNALPPLTAIVLHETSTFQPSSYWWEPIGNAPVNGYIFIWTNSCNYPVAGRCINDNASQIIQYGQRVMINGGGDYRIPDTLDMSAPLSVIVCQNINNQCGIISNVIEIPFGPGVSDPNPIS